MTVLKTKSPALSAMNEKLWLEKACSNLIPELPLWIIEYAWTKRMMEVLIGPPLWLEGDMCLLTPEEPCRIRVVSAEVWRIVQARDFKHFDRVTKFLDVTYMLVPGLVTSIRHMKIVFGLQTLVIMWMLWNDESTARINDKIESMFPNNLPQYYKCSRRYLELMQKNVDEFKSFARGLAGDRSMREAYIRDLIEEHYGERYAQKLEERLSHYLEELKKALPHPTHIEQGAGEKILKKLLARDNASLANILKRLLNCGKKYDLSSKRIILAWKRWYFDRHFICLSALTTDLSLDDSVSPSLTSNACVEPREADVCKQHHGTLHVVSRPSQDSTKKDQLSQTSSKELFVSQGLWQRSQTAQESSAEVCGDGREVACMQMSGEHEIYHTGCSRSLLEQETVPRGTQTEIESEAEINRECTEQMCSRHGKKMRSILQECSEELDGETVQAECTPTSPKSPPPVLTHSQTSASSHQHSLATNTSASSDQDSSSTNISLSYIQEMSTNHQSVSASKSSENHVTPSPTSISKQRNTLRETRGATEQVLATVDLGGQDVKLSLESQSFLMQSRLLQPQVCLHRLNMEECRDSFGDVLDEEHESEGIMYAFFDANTLYSDTYSESDSADSDDPDYNPNGR
ncbi:hypothetical protein E1301_Tti008834 [Triplophysa tibetana]|uniref:TERF1-interacting nuclear factor 2 N-terminal domain-containing protein n=1 Tax=Triplophysa tibetana TaxID=1572043 RepID=A0A5A9P0K5_9TELE|nr:hypothetical protein E1301_Tti008834 [Triplophysa tibetana]